MTKTLTEADLRQFTGSEHWYQHGLVKRVVFTDGAKHVADAGGALYGGFSGFLGQGRMEMLEPVGGDVWTLPCPRALDHTPPGDWTLAFRRDAAGRVAGATVGCWLARRLAYVRVG